MNAMEFMHSSAALSAIAMILVGSSWAKAWLKSLI